MAALLLLALGGCSQQPYAPDSQSSPRFGGGVSVDQSANNGRRLAISHRFTLLIPNSEIESQQQRHLAECAKLGCTVVNTSINRSDQGATGASALVRIKPENYETFAAMLAAPPAKVTYHSQTTVDMTQPVVDTEKRLAAKTRLRERLTELLNDQNTKTAADLVSIEKELAQAQGDIESMTAQLDTLHNRTDMVNIDISYVGTSGRYGELDLTPVHEAVIGIGQTLIRSLAWLITCLAAVAPWIPIIALLWWLFHRSLRRRRVRNAPLSAGMS
jgi:hypothetical protein